MDGLASGRLLRFAGAFSPLVAMLVEDVGFEGVYVSGAALSADLGLPDIGLTTLTEVSERGHQIARRLGQFRCIDGIGTEGLSARDDQGECGGAGRLRHRNPSCGVSGGGGC